MLDKVLDSKKARFAQPYCSLSMPIAKVGALQLSMKIWLQKLELA